MRRLHVTRAAIMQFSRLLPPVFFVTLNLAVSFPTARAAITATGDVEPADPTTWNGSTSGYVGKTSNGTLTIDYGSSMQSGYGYIGYNSGVSGEATIDGNGSTWTSGNLSVGYYGSGTLSISGGAAAVSNGETDIGWFSGSTGEATVDGIGSTWTSNVSGFYVGNFGSGELAVTGGATVHTISSSIGYNSGSSGVATVDGNGSTWTNNMSLNVGYSGAGTLNITNGGAVSANDTYVARMAGSTGTINFGPGGGTLTTQTLYASPAQLVGTGTINAHGLISDIDLVFDSTHGAIQAVPGFGSVTVNLDVSNPSTADVAGAGYKGAGSLTIREGITVYSAFGYIGYSSGSAGVVTVDGAGSAWTDSGTLNVGNFGSSGTLNITGGAAVTVAGGTYVARYAGSTGTINFGPGGGTLNAGLLFASPTQLMGKGTINTHGLVSDLDIVFDSAASLNQTFTLNGQPGQNVAINLDMASAVGYLGAGYKGSGSLTIREGISVNSAWGYIGYSPGSRGVVTVDGIGSAWSMNSSSSLYIGFNGSGILNVTGGGAVSDSYGFITGATSSGPGSTSVVTVDGIGSTWTNGFQPQRRRPSWQRDAEHYWRRRRHGDERVDPISSGNRCRQRQHPQGQLGQRLDHQQRQRTYHRRGWPDGRR